LTTALLNQHIFIIIIIIEVSVRKNVNTIAADSRLFINIRLPETLASGLCTVLRNLGYPRPAADPVLIYIYHCQPPERRKGKKSILGVCEENAATEHRTHVCS
jgi:hypothetical protein